MLRKGCYTTKDGHEVLIRQDSEDEVVLGIVRYIGIIPYQSENGMRANKTSNMYDAGDKLDIEMNSWKAGEE